MNARNSLSSRNIKWLLSSAILLLSDMLFMYLSLKLAVYIRNLVSQDDELYSGFHIIYAVTILVFMYNGIYTKRYDFWHESKVILKSCFLSASLILFFIVAYKIYGISRLVFALWFLIIFFILPYTKFGLKRFLYNIGLWKKPAKIIGQSGEFEKIIFENHYLGYVKAKDKYETLFISSNEINAGNLNKLVEENLKKNHEIIFSPILKDYDFSQSQIYSIFDSRQNLFSIENSLLNPINLALKIILDFMIFLLLLPIFLFILVVIIIIMKINEPGQKVFFTQNRLGKNGRVFKCLKFRTMKTDQSFMENFLMENPSEVEYYEKFHKFKNDPRITKVGKFLRATSLDELPQLFNVLKFEMSVVGPRPYMVSERHKMGKSLYLILATKPGITGLWQVSGRSNTDFKTRIEIDVWYVKNWSLYNDMVILIKTIKSVVLKKGAK